MWYNSYMHPIQKKLLQIASLNDIDTIRQTDLVVMVGCEHPSQIAHHKEQLIKHGQLVRKEGRLVPALSTAEGLLTIPVLGEADCGEATKYADGQIIDNLVVSPSMMKVKHPDRVYALIAKGDSMNRAAIKGKTICNDDYVIVEKDTTYTPKDGEIVVSNVGGLANIKRFKRDVANSRIVLLPDSDRQDYAPIFIHEDDDYSIEGRVVDVIKGVSQ